MSSPSSVEGISPLDTPSTPQNANLGLPAGHQLQRSASPDASLLAAPGTAPLLASSMTPPPSSQNLNSRNPVTASRISATPDPPILASPPPTLLNGTKREAHVGPPVKPTAEQLATASPEMLREVLEAVLADNARLDAVACEARMSAAHYKLQHNLLTIESEEAIKHLEVEQEMTLREVELLQHRVQDAQDPPALEHYRNRCKQAEAECRKLADDLRKAKKIIIWKEDDIADLQANVRQLKERISLNRRHINEMRSPGGIFHNPSLHNSPTTPKQYRSTPKQTPMTGRSVRQARDHSQEPFAALLLADRVLSQENNSAPTTPIVNRRPDHRTPNRHNRNVQSLSSLPATPGSVRPATSSSTLLPSAQFSPQAEARVATAFASGMSQHPRERRRKSRDSTISASDTEEIARAAVNAYREVSPDIQESQASQSATEMLRLDPRESFEVAASRTSTPIPTGDKNTLQQAKIFGSVTKAVHEKRKRGDDEYPSDYTVKKPRSTSNVGLGIGFEGTRA